MLDALNPVRSSVSAQGSQPTRPVAAWPPRKPTRQLVSLHCWLTAYAAGPDQRLDRRPLRKLLNFFCSCRNQWLWRGLALPFADDNQEAMPNLLLYLLLKPTGTDALHDNTTRGISGLGLAAENEGQLQVRCSLVLSYCSVRFDRQSALLAIMISKRVSNRSQPNSACTPRI